MQTGNKPALVIVCGLPGSGKTTYARKLANDLKAIRLCPDEWMDALSIDIYDEDKRAKIETLQWQLGQDLLRAALTVIIEWGTWGKSERDTLRTEARSLDAAVELHYLSASPEILFERIQKRGMENPPIKWESILEWTKTFQEPAPAETALFDKFVTIKA